MRLIDAHHHLWDLGAVHYPWLMERGARRFFGDPTPIQRDYLPADFRQDIGSIPIGGSVHIQVGAAPDQSVAETRWLDRQAAATGLPSAIIAYADLPSPALAGSLSEHIGASARLRGVRQIVSRHPDEDRVSGTPGLLEDKGFTAGLALLAERGLSFDLQLSAPYLRLAADVFGTVPDLQVALCHAGSPWDQSAQGLKGWRDGLGAFAELPGACIKLSGVGMFDPDWTGQSLERVVAPVLEIFGADRVMWGSNFPVDKLYRSYRALFDAIWSLIPADDREQVFGGTARRFYRLD
jgi:predicted TIM-barrel fold metal-dependent hydrolase